MQNNKQFSSLFESYLQPIKVEIGETIKGTIVSIKKEVVVVDVGLKSYSSVPIEEFKNSSGEVTVKVGDEIDFVLENIEDGKGTTKLSREKAIIEEAWKALQEAETESHIVKGKVINQVKGGFSLDIKGISAFLPGSLIDKIELTPNFLANLEEQVLAVKVIKLDYEKKNIVVSRIAVYEAEKKKRQEDFFSDIKIGKILDGVVKNITHYGAFINLGNGIDGLLHITDISWKRIKHPQNILKIGQKVQVKVIKYEIETKKLFLGFKQLQHDPWYPLKQNYPSGYISKGKITNILNYGFFVQIVPGIEGLVHMTDFVWLHNNKFYPTSVQIGKVVKYMVLFVDIDKRRISLGTKQCVHTPLCYFCKKYKIGDIIPVNVKSFYDMGLVVETPYKISGIVPIKNFKENKNNFKIGDSIKTIILDIDFSKERIFLGINTISPFYYLINKYKKGNIIYAQLKDFDDEKLILAFENFYKMTINLNKLTNNEKKIISTICINDIFQVKIINIDITNKLIEIELVKKLEDENIEKVLVKYNKQYKKYLKLDKSKYKKSKTKYKSKFKSKVSENNKKNLKKNKNID